MLRTSFTAAALVALLGIVACGGDDNDKSATSTVSAASADPARYCALTRQLDAEGEKFFAGLGREATEQQFEAAERRFVEQSGAKLEELRRVAPRQIAADVEALLAGMRQRAGLKPAIAVTEAQSGAADKRIQAYEKRTCAT
ncbi:MAG TPA: hypothetical protein VNA28_05940 [Solirubrobacteraceae bacterium]|nr:hypothetical protein [Solirubrobacteraceae bacterium]